MSEHATISTIPVFYCPAMVAEDVSHTSPSAAKPAAVVADWQAKGFAIDLRNVSPASEELISLAHDPRFVADVPAGRADNGFGNRLPQVIRSLPFTCGAMADATLEAVANGVVACAPVSGFHHAHYDHTSGFCTFNGLVIAALALRRARPAARVGIIDLDYHWGDGTHDIVKRLKLDWIEHHGIGPRPPRPYHAERYLGMLPDIVRKMAGCDVLLYQAGADAHIYDPLGGWMTYEQLARRDRIVFCTAREIGLPVAWNLAGGYQRDEHGGIEPVLAIHRETMRVCESLMVAEAGVRRSPCGATRRRKGN